MLIRIKQKAAGRRFLLIISLLAISIVFFSRCFDRHSGDDPRGDGYAGTNACTQCHQSISTTYAHSNHYTTSAVATIEDLKRLTSPAKRYYFGDSSYIRIEELRHTLLQSLFLKNGDKGSSERFDIAFGSGEKAQTYGYWKDSQLYELPLTYLSRQGTWTNSPGFPASHARYNRAIVSRCFECHASYVDKSFVRSGTLAVSERLDRRSIVYGIDCERCHGPGSAHVQFQEENPSVKTAKYMTRIGLLTRQQKMDICAACHSGNDLEAQRSLFAFVPGDTLSHYFIPSFGERFPEPDVHGKQTQLLMASACYRGSAQMSCITCHDAHSEGLSSKVGSFIAKCMDCHQGSRHATDVIKDNEQKKRDFNLVGQNCIDCHMPMQVSKTLNFNNDAESKSVPYLIRTHKIGIY